LLLVFASQKNYQRIKEEIKLIAGAWLETLFLSTF